MRAGLIHWDGGSTPFSALAFSFIEMLTLLKKIEAYGFSLTDSRKDFSSDTSRRSHSVCGVLVVRFKLHSFFSMCT
jgi:hypothetical protein